MALEIKLNQKLSQSLVMTPQLQQAIKLLQLGRLDYLEVIEKELLENPVLEDGREESPESDAIKVADEVLAASGIDEAVSSVESLKDLNATAPEGDDASFDSIEATVADDVDWYAYLDGYTDRPSSGSGNNSFDGEERPSLEATVSSPEGLVSHVLWQLRTTDLPAEDYDIAVQVLGNLDRNGYLQSSFEELVPLCGRPVEDIERVVGVIQYLDPPGIAARDLRECLLIQLKQLGQQDCLSWRIVDKHLAKLEIRRYDLIARDEQIEVTDVYEAIKVIQKLEPRPGRPFIDDQPIYITPDIYVRKVGDEYVISLNEAGMPRLRVNTQYREMLLSGTLKDAPNKEYLQDRIRSAAWLIKSIHQRQQTIYKVTESIMKFQREFLEKGVSALKPLVLRDVAESVSMHESTVSRVTTNKYVHTPQGVFELKFFFTSGLRGTDGDVSSESVKERIRTLITAEDSKKPLSDQQLVEMLKGEGVDIARRTVAKYREMMNILSSSRRKKVF